jgi:antitoxin Phd
MELSLMRENWMPKSGKKRVAQPEAKAPQRITRQGKEEVGMIADEENEKLVGKSRQPKDLWQFFRESPLVGVELDLERKKDISRDIEL